MRYYMILSVTIFAAGCAYHNPTAPAPVVVTPSTAAAAIRLVAASRADRQLDIVATVLTASGGVVAGSRVTFTTSAGTLSVESVITDDAGIAHSILTTTQTVTVHALAAGLDASVTLTARQPHQ